MDARRWSVCLVEPNRFEAQIVVDLLRFSGVQRIHVLSKPEEALEQLQLVQPNILIVALGCDAFDALDWTRRFRRDKAIPCRKAPLFLTTKALNRAVAESCRHAGANAVIGKPTSVAALTGTIKKVLAHPRPFIEAAGYVGPCRRAGIVTTHSPYRRRRNDEAKHEAAADEAPAPVRERA